MGLNSWQRQMKWAYYASNEHRLGESAFRRDALGRARAIMRDARRNVETLVERLSAQNYGFRFPKEAFTPPSEGTREAAADLESRGLYLPVAVRAWLEEVGSVNLMGSHPGWRCKAYAEQTSEGIWYTDPLVVELDATSILSQIEEWDDARELDGPEEVGPFRIEFAPDDIHKANVSGGAAYSVDAFAPSVDPVVRNERHCFSFVAHLRHSFQWAGFPGFELIDERPQNHLEMLRAGFREL